MLIALPVCLTCAVSYAGPQDPVRMLAAAPLRFEPAPEAATFVAAGLNYRFRFQPHGATLRSGEQVVSLKFANASRDARMQASGRLQFTTNILHGANPADWRMGIPNYSRLEVDGLYHGIDVAYYGNSGQLEYDLLVHPGSDPRQVRLFFEGVEPRIDRDGNLVAGFVQKAPVAYQIGANGQRSMVETRYRRNADGTFSFALGRYDRRRDVIIDPVLQLSLYLSGALGDVATAIGHDAKGHIYVAGSTYSSDFGTTGNTVSTTLGGLEDVFLAQIDPTAPVGSQILLSTFLGGSDTDILQDMTVTPSGMVFLTGSTSSSNFPNVNASQGSLNGTSDAFVMALDPSQSGSAMIVYSTYLGGSGADMGSGIAVDAKGRMYVVGTTRSTDFTIVNGLQSGTGAPETAFVSVLDPSQSGSGTLVYSTYIGGGGGEFGRGIAVAPDSTAWVVGSTYSTDFPVANNPYQVNYNSGGDAFVAHIDPGKTGLSSLLYATYLGGAQGPDEAKRVVVDPAGRVIVAGYTGSGDFPVTPDAIQAVYGGNFDAFVTILDPSNSTHQIVYSTFYGGKQPEIAYDLKRDRAGNLYVAGLTMSPDLFVSGNALPPVSKLTMNGFVLQFTTARPGLGGINYSSYIGGPGIQIAYGIDYDANQNIYVAGFTSSGIFDPFGGAPKSTAAGDQDAFVAGINACGFTLSFASEHFSSQGGNDTIAITTASAGCSWTATSPVDWVKLSPAAGSANGSVQITVAPNTTGASRSTTLIIAGQQFALSQD